MNVLHCPGCGSPERVEIRAGSDPDGPQWSATCGGCRHAWEFDG